jgi:Tfp pilus assembly protein PilF
MERCPTCQARLREEPVCARCRTDLSLPLAAEARACANLRRAIARLGEGDTAAAREALEESLQLKRSPLALLLRGFLASREH